jgi:AraC-like DNA-binding protein
MTSLIRAAGLRGLVPLVDSLGGNGAALLERYRIPVDSPEDEHALISASAAGRVLEAAAEEVRCPDLGLRLAEKQDVGILGSPLAIAIENSLTIGAAIECFTQFLFIHSPALSIAQIPDPEGAAQVIGLQYDTGEIRSGRYRSVQALNFGLGLIHRFLRFGDQGYGLRSVHLPHPMLAPIARYTSFFGADVRFQQSAGVLRIPASFLSAPLAGDPVLRDLAIEHLKTRYPATEQTLSTRVRNSLRYSLGTPQAGLNSVAQSLRMHPRTLQRRLAAEKTTFETMLNEVRRESVARLLKHTELPLAEITTLVGLSEQSALTRACRRWFNATPTEVRNGSAIA